MIATTRRIWMNPPSVKEVIKPRSHRAINTTAIVVSMVYLAIRLINRISIAQLADISLGGIGTK